MTQQEFLRELEVMLEIEVGSLTGEETLDSLTNWDSFQILNFVMLVDEKVKLVVDGAAAGKAKTVNDLIKLVAERLTP